MTLSPELRPAEHAAAGTVSRVAYPPDPWTWVPWQYAPFTGRFDDANGQFRVLYAGTTRLACYLEVTAQFRPDLTVLAEIDDLEGDPADGDYPHVPVGVLPAEWLASRVLGAATITGTYVDLPAKETLAWLRPRLADRLVHYHVPDLDGAAIRTTVPRELTREIASLLYRTPLSAGDLPDGLRFESRHGADLTLYAVYERPGAGDNDHSKRLTDTQATPLDQADPDLLEAMRIHGLRLG